MQFYEITVLKVCCPYAAAAESFLKQQTPDHFMWSHTPYMRSGHSQSVKGFQNEIYAIALKIQAIET